MSSSIKTTAKSDFLRWFLRHHQVKKREAVWVLNYLLGEQRFLENVHFVENAELTPRGLVISALGSEGSPITLYKNGKVLEDAEKIFHDIRMNPDEALYLQLNFENTKPNPGYLTVLEENPYAPHDANLSEEEKQAAEAVLSKSIQDFRRTQLLHEIDDALDEKNEARFQALTIKLQQLQ